MLRNKDNMEGLWLQLHSRECLKSQHERRDFDKVCVMSRADCSTEACSNAGPIPIRGLQGSIINKYNKGIQTNKLGLRVRLTEPGSPSDARSRNVTQTLHL